VSAGMDYSIDHDPVGSAHLVTASGELDVAAAPQLSTVLAMGVAGFQSAVVLDLTDVTFIDSTALGVVLRASEQLGAVRKPLLVVVPDGPVERLLALTNLTQHFAVYPNRQEAVAAAEAVSAR
jgi:anti-sigma B factor antagonist